MKMRILDNPKLSVKLVAPGLKTIVIETSLGELIGCEVNDDTAAKWAKLIASNDAQANQN